MHRKPNHLNIFLVLSAAFVAVCILSSFSWNKRAYADTQPDGLPIMEAVTSAFQYAPDILLKHQDIRSSQGVLQESKGQFDLTLQMDTSYSDQNSPVSNDLDQEVKSTSHNFKITKQLRNGVSLNSPVDFSQTKTEMCVFPIMFAAVASSLANLLMSKGVGRNLGRILVVFSLALFLSSAIGTFLGVVGSPGTKIDQKSRSILGKMLAGATSENGGKANSRFAPDALVKLSEPSRKSLFQNQAS